MWWEADSDCIFQSWEQPYHLCFSRRWTSHAPIKRWCQISHCLILDCLWLLQWTEDGESDAVWFLWLSNKGQYKFCLAYGSACASIMEATGLRKPHYMERPWASALVSNPSLHAMCSSEWMSLLIIPATRHWITPTFEVSSWGSKHHETDSLPSLCLVWISDTQRIWAY